MPGPRSRFLCVLLAALAAPALRAETNVALNKPTDGDVGFDYPTANGNDGNTANFTHADNPNPPPGNPYWRVNLLGDFDLKRVEIVDRVGCCDPNRLNGSEIRFYDGAQNQLGDPVTISGLPPNNSAGTATRTYDNGGAGWQGVAFVRIDGYTRYFQFAEFRAFADDPPPGENTNLALGKPVIASGPTWNGFPPGLVADGNPSTISHPLTNSGTEGFYFQVDLGAGYFLDRIRVRNRGDGCCTERLSNYRVSVFADGGGGNAGAVGWSADVRTDGSNSGVSGIDTVRAEQGAGVFAGRFIRVENLNAGGYAPQIAEIEAYPAPLPVVAYFHTDHGNITASGDPDLPESATLSWSVSNYEALELIPGIGVVDGPTGSLVVAPAATTTYTLVATNASGTRTAMVTIGVDEAELAPVLSEFLGDNGQGIEDEDGDKSDWVEIYNPNGFSLNLDGFYLTDVPGNPMKWRLPPVSVEAGGYLVVFASTKDRVAADAPLHANFSLNRNGEYLALVARDGSTVLGQFPGEYPAVATYPRQGTDISYGLGAGGGEAFLDPPTPGSSNGPGFAGFVEGIACSVDRGVYTAPQSVAISTPTEGAGIRYTTDGSEPSATHGTPYTAPIGVATTTVLRAVAYKAGFTASGVGTYTYIFPDTVAASGVMNPAITQHATYGPQVTDALTDLPSMSIATPGAINGSSEVRASIELIHPDGAPGFQEDCGVKHFGGEFTDFPKKNFRLYFRGEYGAPKLEYPLFADYERGGIEAVDEFDQLNLRGGSHDMKQRGFYLSNRFTDDSMLDMGNVNPHGRYVHLYLNGTYWGLYHLRERWHAAMLARYLGGDKSDYESINGNYNVGGWAVPGDPYDGDGSAWERVKSLNNDYEAVRPFLDVRHYIDYMLLFMSGNAEDEYRCVGPKDIGSGLKWFLNDADGHTRAPGNRTGRGTPGRQPGDGPGSIFSMLVAEGHPDFKALLADRIHFLFFNDGPMTPARNIARLQARVAEVQRPMIPEIARWGGSGGNDSWPSPANWEGAKNAYLNGVLPGLTATVLGYYRGAGFYPSTGAPVFNQQGGDVPGGFRLAMSASGGTIHYTVDGSDPRLPGGGISPRAFVYDDGTASETPVPQGAPWKFLDTGSDLGGSDLVAGNPGYSTENWKHPGFDDSGWDSGHAELGYGEGDEATVVGYGPNSANKFVTTYFRHAFEVGDAGNVLAASLRVKRDDGVIVYLNGREVGRSSMPAGAVAFDGFAFSAADDGKDFHAFAVSPLWFENGVNVIAAELHQATANSSDLSFDLEFAVTRSTGQGGDNLVLGKPTWLRARARTGGEWSAINEAFFTVDGAPPVSAGQIVVTELHYHPANSARGEFIEIANVSAGAVNLRGARFSDGLEYAFSDTYDTALAGGQRLILVGSLFSFQQTYGIDVPVAGIYAGSLDNDGERLALEGAGGEALIDFTYNDGALWPQSPDGGGASLVFRGGDPNDPLAWRPSVDGTPTPVGADGAAFSGDPHGDANGNGVADLLDYALGADATGPEMSVDADGHLLLAFERLIGSDGAAIGFEVSADLLDWDEDAGAGFTLVSRQELGARERLTYRSAVPLGPGVPLYARLRATLVP